MNHRTIPYRLRSNSSLWLWNYSLTLTISSIRRTILLLAWIHWRINLSCALLQAFPISCWIQSRVSYRPLFSKTFNHWFLTTFHLNRIRKRHICFTSDDAFGITTFLHLNFEFAIISCKATSWSHVLWVWCLVLLFNTGLRSNSQRISFNFINSTLLSSKNNISIR